MYTTCVVFVQGIKSVVLKFVPQHGPLDEELLQLYARLPALQLTCEEARCLYLAYALALLQLPPAEAAMGGSAAGGAWADPGEEPAEMTYYWDRATTVAAYVIARAGFGQSLPPFMSACFDSPALRILQLSQMGPGIAKQLIFRHDVLQIVGMDLKGGVSIRKQPGAHSRAQASAKAGYVFCWQCLLLCPAPWTPPIVSALTS